MYGIKCICIQNLSPSILKLLQIIICVVYTNRVILRGVCVGTCKWVRVDTCEVVSIGTHVWLVLVLNLVCILSGVFFVATDLLFYYTEVILLIHKIMYYMFVSKVTLYLVW